MRMIWITPHFFCLGLSSIILILYSQRTKAVALQETVKTQGRALILWRGYEDFIVHAGGACRS
jgi:hypothetical protein